MAAAALSSPTAAPRQLAASRRSRAMAVFALARRRLLLFSLLLVLSLGVRQTSAIDFDPCGQHGCFPKTGNLLVGRERRLSATSTCGVRGPERFCIVSHLEDRKKCFPCDSTREFLPYVEPNRYSHRIENVVTERFEMRNKKWWQSENGVQNVSIHLELEAEFHFTHLVMTFKSFRPAAMLIERSSDFGKTWHVYRYFAYDCAESFAGIPLAPADSHFDKICTDKYSNVAPSTGGEVVHKVLSPHIPLEDPYADDIQGLLRITNLRINFTKLHTLGDDLLDYRPEIDEKYYYAIYDMVVRGSCACYGHAQICLPVSERDRTRDDMVHGRCHCQHHTAGLNCEKCEDFFNDLPWRPATAAATNECRRCECHRHATRCHFDKAVFEASPSKSGGVCDDCMHNTVGVHCEHCKPMFYREPGRSLDDENGCQPCRCHLPGSASNGICVSESTDERRAGECTCKQNVAGEYCDGCKNGFWNMREDNALGCEQCSCLTKGTHGNLGCDKTTGSCTCKRFVEGDNCDRCLENHFGLSEKQDGCDRCECDLGGSLSETCRVDDGQCDCRPNLGNRTCNTATQGFFCAKMDFLTYEAEDAALGTGVEVERREVPQDERRLTWTGTGFARVQTDSELTFTVENVAVSMLYNVILRYESSLSNTWQDIEVSVIRPDDPSADSPCYNSQPTDDLLKVSLPPANRYAEVRPAVCLESGVSYEIKIVFGAVQPGFPNEHRGAVLLIDSMLLLPPSTEMAIFKTSPNAAAHLDNFERYQCRHSVLSLVRLADLSSVCNDYVCPYAAELVGRGLECDCDPTGSVSGICAARGGQCECKENVVGRRCDRCAPGAFGFGPAGCRRCECHSVGSRSNFCNEQTGQCPCRNDVTYGRQCDQCQPGFWGFPDCRTCECNGHADICEQQTGHCIECRDSTAGTDCDRCRDGYFGDPRIGVDIACKECPCPGGLMSGRQHADTCFMDHSTQQVSCNCQPAYEGERCDSCAINHWGNPNDVGGSCERCDCNDNIDFAVADSCDATTGDCLLCLHHTEGRLCEQCAEGYFGDAKIRSCRKCVCNSLGTNVSAGACERTDGQCRCLQNVVGLTCDMCADNHWNMASGGGCSACECDPDGVQLDADGHPDLECNELAGSCSCRAGRGGRRCSECEDYHWGDPLTGSCTPCDCNQHGAVSQQCHRSNGSCVCNAYSGGARCDECARGYTGQWPHCNECGECFGDWDAILQQLKADTGLLIDQASNIEDTGVASVYDDDFEQMEAKLAAVQAQLDTANITTADADRLKAEIEELSKLIKEAQKNVDKANDGVAETSGKVDQAERSLESLEADAKEVARQTAELEENATKLREEDVEGAYNITQESAKRSEMAERTTEEAVKTIQKSEELRSATEEMLKQHQEDFDEQYQENQKALEELGGKLEQLEGELPTLNGLVCGAKGDPCDEVCGGAGCDVCGGPSCGDAATRKAQQALEFAEEAEQRLDARQAEASALKANVEAALVETDKARTDAEEALKQARDAAAAANATKTLLEEQLKQLSELLESERATPAEIRVMASEVLNMSISQTPEEIERLAVEIRESLAKLNNIDAILEETRGNISEAERLKERADAVKVRAEEILNTTEAVQAAEQKAGEAQQAARSAIDQASNDIDAATADLKTVSVPFRADGDDVATRQIANETEAAEALATGVNESLTAAEEQLKNLKVQYLKIGGDVSTAANSAGMARSKAQAAEQSRGHLENLYSDASAALEKHEQNSQPPTDRADELRERASVLLEQTNKHSEDIKQETKSFNSNEVRLLDYSATLDDLHARLDQCTRALNDKLQFYETCD